MVDQLFGSVFYLLHFNGGNGDTSTTDSGPYHRTASMVGTASISTGQSVYGGSSLYLDGSGYASVAGMTRGATTVDYSIEFWMRPSDITTTQSILNVYADTGWPFLAIRKFGGKIAVVCNSTYNSLSARSASDCFTSANTWYYVQVSFVGGVSYTYVNGDLVLTQSGVAWGDGDRGGALNFEIGSGNGVSGESLFTGYIDDFRFTSGQARSNGEATIPVPGTEFPDSGPPTIADLVAPAGLASFRMGGSAFISPPIANLLLFSGGSAELSAPMQRVSVSTGSLFNLSPPSPTLFSTSYLSNYGVCISAPSASLFANLGICAKAASPKQTLTISATSTSLLGSNITAPSPVLSVSGVFGATAQFALSPPMASFVGYTGSLVSVSSPMGAAKATGTTGSISGILITAPLFQLTAGATAQNHGSAILTAPMGALGGGAVAYLIAPGFHLTAIGSATVAVAYEAYAVNLNHRDPASNNQVTRYTNYPFDRIVRYKNSYFGMNSTGLYLLEGTTDNAIPIPYEVKTHVTDFDATEQKTVVSAYMGGRMGAAETVTLFAGEKTANAYPYTTPRGATPQNYRQKFGRGIKARYYGIGFKGDKEFDLDTLELEINKLPRRI